MDRTSTPKSTHTAGDTVSRRSPELLALEACILDHASVYGCVVLPRTDREHKSAIVAYVITAGPLTLAGLCEHSRTAGMALQPTALVRISNLPLRDDGEIDAAALVALPVVGSDTLERQDALIRSTKGIVDVAVVTEWPIPAETELSIDELMPGMSRPTPTKSAPGGALKAQRNPDAPPSLSIGAPIIWSADRPRNLGGVLARAADRWPTHDVTCIDHRGEHTSTYAALRLRAERIMAGLRAGGLRPGDAVIFQFEHNPDFISAFWGCVLGGFVPTPIPVPTAPDPASPAAAKLKNAWHQLGGPPVLTSAGLEPELLRLRERLNLPDLEFVIVERLLQFPAGEPWYEAAPDDLALYLLTSGSTGLPKAVTQTHGALLSATTAMAQRNGFSVDDVCLNWISLDHVGGIVMCHAMFVALGCRQVQVRTDYFLQDPLRWLDLIARFRATFTWAPNFAFGLVNDRAEEIARRRWDLSSMGFIVNGGEAVVAQTARRFLRLLAQHGLPATAMRPAWGMSETSSAATFSDSFRLDSTKDTDELVEVGPPDPGFEIRIVDDRDTVVPEGYEGRMEVRGPNVTRGYFNNPAANAEAFSADGWFRTGDLGTLRNGRLTITGREKGVIIINGVNYYAHEVEAAVEDVGGTTPSFTAAFSIREPGADTDALVVAFHTAHLADADIVDLMRRIRAAVLERVGIAPRHLLPVRKEDIPKTDIGKIQRQSLTKRFEAGGFADEVKRHEHLTQKGETLPDWFFRPVWKKRSLLSHRPIGPGCVVLLVADHLGVASAADQELRGTGARCVVVARGEIERLRHLVAEVRADERLVILLGEHYGSRPSEGGADESALALSYAASLVDLIRTLTASPRGTAACELVFYDDCAQYVFPGDSLLVAKTCIPGLLRTVSAEHPEISVRHVDLPHGDPQVLAGILLAEIADRSDEPQVAYRGDDRFVSRLAKRPAYPSGHANGLGSSRGFYLITGALGGIGAEVCRYLLRTSDVPLLLVGHRSLEDGGEERRATLSSLQAMGEVHFEPVDVADHQALERAVAVGADRWNRELGGVIHLAGVFEPRLLTAETPDTLAEAFRAKVAGGWNIHRLLLAYPEATLIAFSSVNGYLGGYAAGAYAAANAFLDGLVQHHAMVLGRTAHSLAWSLWDGVGMSRHYEFKDAARRHGFRAVSARQGVLSLAAAVGSEPGHLLIGLDGANPEIERHAATGVVSEELVSYCVCAAGIGDVRVPTIEDPFGTPVPCHIRKVANLSSARGSARYRPTARDSSESQAEPAFGNGLEQIIADAWREVLPTAEIGPDDNFFEVGGDSLLAATASRLLQKKLGREIPITDIYRFPTLRLLAGHYGGSDKTDVAELDDSEGRGQTRRTKRLQRKRRTP